MEIAEVHAEDAGHNKHHCHDQVASVQYHACLQGIVISIKKIVEAGIGTAMSEQIEVIQDY